MTLTEAQYRNGLVQNGLAQVGRLYRDSAVPTNWPPEQFDCSTFTHWLNAKYGIDIDKGVLINEAWPPAEPKPWHKYPGYTLNQQRAAAALGSCIIPFSEIKPGDRLYYDKPGQHHVTMYIGDGKVVHAAGTAYGVIVSPVVHPGIVGHGGKLLTMCVSATKFAKAAGYKFDVPPVIPKPPVVPKPPAKPTVFLSHILAAIKKDGPAAQGHTTYKNEVLLVERGLNKEGLLASSLVDGSAGTASFGKGSAYQKYQERLGYHGQDADGIPGKPSLTTLGRKYGFNVV
jgi:hypothetical protein